MYSFALRLLNGNLGLEKQRTFGFSTFSLFLKSDRGATRRLREALGLLEYNTLNNNIETVYSYFRDHQLPEHLRRLICAPNDQIVLDGNEETTHEDDKSDSDSDNCIDLKQPALV